MVQAPAIEITTSASHASSITMASPEISRLETRLACPYFMPVTKLENGSWPHPSRLPLGCGWSGRCTAPGHEQEIPPQNVLEADCNLGYARTCGWAPQERIWDAVRFGVQAPVAHHRSDVSDSTARVLRLTYVCERDHCPVEHGSLEFDLGQSRWVTRHGDDRIQRMAECFLESYLKRRA